MPDEFFESVTQVEQETSTEVVEILYFFSSILSLVGSGTIILSYFMVKELRRFPFGLVFFLSVCDFFFSIKFFISSFLLSFLVESSDSSLCQIQAMWTQFWGLGSVSWNGIISLNIILLLRNPFMSPKAYVIFYHCYVWSISIITTILLFSSGFMGGTPAYGISGDGTCWIGTEANQWWQLLFLGPLIIYFIISIICFIVSVARVQIIGGYSTKMRRGVLRMLLFSIVFVSIWSEPAFHRIMMAFGYDNVLLEYLDAICVSIQGFMNALVWLSDPYFRCRITQAPFCLRIIYCSLSRKQNKQTKLATEKDLLKEDFGLNSIRKAIVSHIMIGLSQSIVQADYNYDDTKIFATEDYDDVLDVKKFARISFGESVTDSVSKIMEKNRSVCKFTSYAPHVFHRIRKARGISTEAFLRSFDEETILRDFHKQKFSEGRSGSFFLFTPDQRFILKTVPVAEAMLIVHILRSYYHHLKENPETLICKIFGVYSFHSGYSPVVYMFVMNNMFYNSREIHRRYDLKGSWVRREVGEKHKQNPTILGMDQDFVQMYDKINIGPKKKQEFLHSLCRDALFLKNHGIIDYSLLLGIHYREGPPEASNFSHIQDEESVDSESGDFLVNLSDLSHQGEDNGIDSVNGKLVYYFGIIDMLQLYDCNKQSERCAKIFLKCKDPKGLSVQAPKAYCTRFITSITALTT